MKETSIMKQFMRRFGFGLLFAVVVAFLASAHAAQAQGLATDEGPAVEVPMGNNIPVPEAYGTSATTVYTVPAYAFTARDDSAQSTSKYNRYSPTGTEVEASLIGIPSGALITDIELEGCDTSASDQVVFVLFSVDSSGDWTLLSSTGETGSSATPGCGFFKLALSSPHTVDNLNNTYYVAVRGGTTSATTYTAVRVYYKLQVSAAPATATFSDVPTSHMFFQYIEALAAAGITTGYPDGTYGPDNYVTRGQMAVFLSRGFGLHWPY